MSRSLVNPLDHGDRRPWHVVGIIIIVILLSSTGQLGPAADAATLIALLLAT